MPPHRLCTFGVQPGVIEEVPPRRAPSECQRGPACTISGIVSARTVLNCTGNTTAAVLGPRCLDLERLPPWHRAAWAACPGQGVFPNDPSPIPRPCTCVRPGGFWLFARKPEDPEATKAMLQAAKGRSVRATTAGGRGGYHLHRPRSLVPPPGPARQGGQCVWAAGNAQLCLEKGPMTSKPALLSVLPPMLWAAPAPAATARVCQ